MYFLRAPLRGVTRPASPAHSPSLLLGARPSRQSVCVQADQGRDARDAPPTGRVAQAGPRLAPCALPAATVDRTSACRPCSCPTRRRTGRQSPQGASLAPWTRYWPGERRTCPSRARRHPPRKPRARPPTGGSEQRVANREAGTALQAENDSRCVISTSVPPTAPSVVD